MVQQSNLLFKTGRLAVGDQEITVYRLEETQTPAIFVFRGVAAWIT
jgi:hypothetical protein